MRSVQRGLGAARTGHPVTTTPGHASRTPGPAVLVDEAKARAMFAYDELGELLSARGSRGLEAVLGDLGFDLDRWGDVLKFDYPEDRQVEYVQGWGTHD